MDGRPIAWGAFLFAFIDRKSTRLNSSHLVISYAVFCLKKNTGKDTALLAPARRRRPRPRAGRRRATGAVGAGPRGCGRTAGAPAQPTRWSFFFNDTATTEIYTLSLHDALPISIWRQSLSPCSPGRSRSDTTTS